MVLLRNGTNVIEGRTMKEKNYSSHAAALKKKIIIIALPIMIIQFNKLISYI